MITSEKVREQIAHFSSVADNRLSDIRRACERQDDDESFAQNVFKKLDAVTANVRHMYRLVGYAQAIEVADGEWLDSESGLPHVDHIAVNAAFIRELREEEQ